MESGLDMLDAYIFDGGTATRGLEEYFHDRIVETRTNLHEYCRQKTSVIEYQFSCGW